MQDNLPPAPEGVEQRVQDQQRRQTKTDDQEKLHSMIIKRALGVKISTPNKIVLCEVGRLPLAFTKWKLIVKYWDRLLGMDENRLLYKAFQSSISLHSQGHTTWVTHFISNASKIGLNVHFSQQIPILHMMSKLQKEFLRSLEDTFSKTESSKLGTYQIFRSVDFSAQTNLGKIKDSAVSLP